MDIVQINSWINNGKRQGFSYLIIYRLGNIYFPIFMQNEDGVNAIRDFYSNTAYIYIATIKLVPENTVTKISSRYTPGRIRVS